MQNEYLTWPKGQGKKEDNGRRRKMKRKRYRIFHSGPFYFHLTRYNDPEITSYYYIFEWALSFGFLKIFKWADTNKRTPPKEKEKNGDKTRTD